MVFQKYEIILSIFILYFSEIAKQILMGLIAIEGIRFHGYIGCHKTEKRIGNYYEIDVYIDTSLSKAGKKDRLGDTIDYEAIYAIVKDIMSEPANLLEYVADKIIRSIAKRFKNIRSVKVRVAKLNPPLGSEVKKAYVELSERIS